MLKYHAINAGEFRHRETKVWFTYRTTSDPWALAHGMSHEIDVGDGMRFARVLQTVAHVSIDEAADGSPVLESWPLANHSVYGGAK